MDSMWMGCPFGACSLCCCVFSQYLFVFFILSPIYWVRCCHVILLSLFFVACSIENVYNNIFKIHMRADSMCIIAYHVMIVKFCSWRYERITKWKTDVEKLRANVAWRKRTFSHFASLNHSMMHTHTHPKETKTQRVFHLQTE